MNVGGVDCALTYHFEPGSHRDGVTLAVPMTVLNFVSPTQSEWLVAGMIKEKYRPCSNPCHKIRRHCVPLPDFTQNFVDWANAQGKTGQVSLLEALIEYVRLQTMQQLKTSDFKLKHFRRIRS